MQYYLLYRWRLDVVDIGQNDLIKEIASLYLLILDINKKILNVIFINLQVPLGKNNQNLPIGIQVAAAPYNDALCLTVAKYLEGEFGGAITACNVQK